MFLKNFLFTFLYVAVRNEGKLEGTDCMNKTSVPFQEHVKTNSSINLIETTMANNEILTSMANSGMCNLSLNNEN